MVEFELKITSSWSHNEPTFGLNLARFLARQTSRAKPLQIPSSSEQSQRFIKNSGARASRAKARSKCSELERAEPARARPARAKIRAEPWLFPHLLWFWSLINQSMYASIQYDEVNSFTKNVATILNFLFPRSVQCASYQSCYMMPLHTRYMMTPTYLVSADTWVKWAFQCEPLLE